MRAKLSNNSSRWLSVKMRDLNHNKAKRWLSVLMRAKLSNN
jgi:hypothetical protein